MKTCLERRGGGEGGGEITYGSVGGDIDFPNAAERQGGGSMVTAKLFDERVGEGRVGFKVLELGWVLKERYDALF